MAFQKNGQLIPFGAPILRHEIVANSTVVTVGDAVIFDTDGFAALGTAGAALLGHVNAISTDKGVGVNTDGTTGAEMGSFVNTFTCASDNETASKVRAEIDISQFTLYSVAPDAALGTTPGSDQAGVYFDLASEDTLDESTAADTAAQYHSFGVDATDSTRVIVNIFESSVFTQA